MTKKLKDVKVGETVLIDPAKDIRFWLKKEPASQLKVLEVIIGEDQRTYKPNNERTILQADGLTFTADGNLEVEVVE